ncbi:MAG: hypothetical protein SOR11_04965 [Fusobacterium sp.]|uniref:hypothetical protein n=1 Tax=Fusobacterium sp. TaxID=68766 RepID=UPI002A760398|nr:hypothetical protein [Fusobacterium sp.]MDY3059335.1 hypothetical protein [Fusobacterium sp.]
MIKFINLENYLEKRNFITVRFVDYEVKSLTLREWIKINTIDFEKINTDYRDTCNQVINIMLPSLDTENLGNIELFDVLSQCLSILANKKDTDEIENIEENNNDDEVTINFDYLLVKYCHYTNSTIEEALNTNANIFFNALNGIEALIGEKSLRLAEIVDNHLHLKSKDGNTNYKRTLEKYSSSFKKGVKVVQGQDYSGLMQLKAMLEGVK